MYSIDLLLSLLQLCVWSGVECVHIFQCVPQKPIKNIKMATITRLMFVWSCQVVLVLVIRHWQDYCCCSWRWMSLLKPGIVKQNSIPFFYLWDWWDWVWDWWVQLWDVRLIRLICDSWDCVRLMRSSIMRLIMKNYVSKQYWSHNTLDKTIYSIQVIWHKSLMEEWLEQASQWHEMNCHDVEVMGSSPVGWNLWCVYSTSVKVALEYI